MLLLIHLSYMGKRHIMLMLMASHPKLEALIF